MASPPLRVHAFRRALESFGGRAYSLPANASGRHLRSRPCLGRPLDQAREELGRGAHLLVRAARGQGGQTAAALQEGDRVRLIGIEGSDWLSCSLVKRNAG